MLHLRMEGAEARARAENRLRALLRSHKSALSLALSLIAGLSQPAFAQSSGTEAIEERMADVVVSAPRERSIGIVQGQTAPKSRITVTGDYFATQTAGNTLFQGLNQLPGVNFTSSDAFGTSGGNLRIRGFDGSRVSVTFDGVPLNDSGNYALFTNQMLDPELIDRVEVNLGTTDVDSPTASAIGGTVAYRTQRPPDEFGGQAILTAGAEDFSRAFFRLDTGAFGPRGTRAFAAVSYQNYDKFKGPGELEKKQINAALRQDFDNGNFIGLALHYNENRNAFYRTTTAANFRVFGRDYDNLSVCARDAPTAGVVDNDNLTTVPSTPTLLATDNPLNTSSCTNFYGVRINPSDTGNIRMQSLWHLGDAVRLTFDPSWQYTLADGGGTSSIAETLAPNSPDVRIIGASNAAGVDLNGDGDLMDTVRFFTPNVTHTQRAGATASLIWDVGEDHHLRVAYTWDRAHHRQTGVWGPLTENGYPENVFAGREGQRVLAADGDVIRGRDRFSIAELKQYTLEWRGQFADGRMTAAVGVRAPLFTRELNQYCYTPDGGSGNSGAIGAAGGVLCTSRAPNAVLASGNVTFVTPTTGAAVEFIAPYSEEVEFDDILPNAGLSFQVLDNQTLYASYAQGLSAPRTDSLYSVRRQLDGSIGRPLPASETTESYDLGWRFSGSRAIASVAAWRIDFADRIVQSFDSDLGFSVDRNVGGVEMSGFEAQLGQRLGEIASLSMAVGHTRTELQDNLLSSMSALNERIVLPLKGKELVETPEWTFALRGDIDVTERLRVGVQGKHVDERFSTDLNDETTPAYTVLDLDASYSFRVRGFEAVELQLVISNLTDEDHFGVISSGVGGTPGVPYCVNETTGAAVACGGPSTGFFSVGAPRTATFSVKLQF